MARKFKLILFLDKFSNLRSVYKHFFFNFRKRPENPTQRAQSAATTLQKNWRKETDKVTQLKEEVRNLRTDDHIKHLTKELASAKQALERERKLRSLQMDAIKVQKFLNMFSDFF